MMIMRSATLFLISVLLFCSHSASSLDAAWTGDEQHVEAEAFLVENSPAEGLLVAVQMKIDPGWHVYWQNPGEAGMPVTIRWELPEGFRSVSLEYPAPVRFESDGAISFGYKDEVVLFSRIVPEERTDDRSFPESSFPLSAELSWLSCGDVCLPGSAELFLEQKKAEPAQKKLADIFLERIPQPLAKAEGRLAVERLSSVDDGGESVLELVFSGPEAAELKDFYPLDPESGIDIKKIAVGEKQVRLPLSDGSKQPQSLEGVVVTAGGAYVIEENVLPAKAMPGAAEVSGSFPLMLALAFFGGMLLNVMPCVLPVLGLKVFSLVGTEASGTARHKHTGRYLSLVFASGILFSFWVLAAFVWGLQGMGEQIGWGFQFQSPAFVLFIAAVVFAFSLSLFGVFEIGAPAVSGKLGRVASHHDILGAFVSGVLATTLATPCTAPFLGTALGFAFAQLSWVVFLFFTVIALGMAFPYVLLAWHPAWLKFLPKPGHWMFLFKQVMGFVLVAVVLWLASILNTQSGGDGLLKLFMLLFVVTLVLWLVGNWAGHGASFVRQLAVWAGGLAIIGGAYFQLLPETAEPGKDCFGNDKPGVSGERDANGVVWQQFTPALFDELIGGKKTVFLEFTAEWCLTCKVLEKSILSDKAVGEELLRGDVVAVKADWTTRDDAVTNLLKRFGRSGVPLFVIIPQGELEQAIVLPEVVTVEMVLSALRDAQA